jgi:hypothetical protein
VKVTPGRLRRDDFGQIPLDAIFPGELRPCEIFLNAEGYRFGGGGGATGGKSGTDHLPKLCLSYMISIVQSTTPIVVANEKKKLVKSTKEERNDTNAPSAPKHAKNPIKCATARIKSTTLRKPLNLRFARRVVLLASRELILSKMRKHSKVPQ